MRRLCTIILFLGFMTTSFSQQTYVPINFNALKKKLSKSDSEIQHPKKSLASKTWVKRGELLHDIYKVDIDQVYDGMDPMSMKLFYKEPKSTETLLIDDIETTVYEYERVKYFFQEDRFIWWEKTEEILEDPLSEAYSSFIKALDLDSAGKGKLIPKIKDNFIALKSSYRQSGLNEYYSGNKKKGLDQLLMVNKINELDIFGNEIDTLMIQYSGIIAREIGEYKIAVEQYKKLAEINYGGPNTYLLIKEDCLAMEDTLGAIEVLEEGFDIYPDSINLVANLVDLYIRTNNIETGLNKINESININPEKGEFYYWKGRLLLNSGEEDNMIDKVLEVYNDAIKYNPTLYYVYYDMGLIYFLQGQDLFNQGGMERDAKRRELYNEVATEKYKSAIPKLKNALEYNTSNDEIKRETLDTLRRIYYRLQMNDEYEEVNKKIMEMRNQ